jgi:hypothetical protein
MSNNSDRFGFTHTQNNDGKVRACKTGFKINIPFAKVLEFSIEIASYPLVAK